ncbi:aldo/keto reductase [Orrella sp. JC864]|uniref:aldo/keto reductase n=1 Tax=Orrella sp. JC864 TaxID=3120298 RepID=UPI00300B192E
MNYRRLGRSNLRVSPLCLGTMMFGEQTPDPEAADIVALARERGVNFIDTADVYNKGNSERVLGKLLQGQRHDWVLATKTGNRFGDGPNQSHYSRQWIYQSVEGSLQRLQTDYIDILYLHRDFHEENLEEAVQALGDLIRAGKLRSFGVSNFRGWRIAQIVELCRQLGVPQPVVCQPYYNMLNRGPEVEILPACQHYGLGVVPYSPIARGVLTGKYQPGEKPAADTRAGRGDARILATEFREESLRIAKQLVDHAAQRGVAPGHFATAWVLANPIVTSVIAGPRTLAQFEDYFGALEVSISAEEEALVDGWVAPGHPSTPGYNDPSYPFHGRPVAGKKK